MTSYYLDAIGFSPLVHLAHFVRSEFGLDIPSRVIEDLELVLVTEGEGDYFLPDRVVRYGPGSLIVTPPFQEHSYRSLGTPMAHFALHFDPQAGWGESHRREGQAGRFSAELRYRDATSGASVLVPHHIPRFPDAAGDLFADVVARWEECRLELLASARLRLAATVHGILAMVVEACSSGGERGSARLARAAALIDARLAESLTTQELAAAAGYSPTYFTAVFGRAYGLSPMEYLASRRVARARELLATTNLAVKEIAARCGYPDPYYFSRVFAGRCGLCPTRYRALASPGTRA
ncbi:MAG: AraC family transcriptional regulator [Spirochaetaceae bacterium]|nr:AraC family transcriptional regulator [Spirochaetaceae bacterium]